MVEFFESEETESIESGVKMTKIPNFMGHFLWNWSKWVLENVHFHMVDFFESNKSESIEPGVKITKISNFYGPFTWKLMVKGPKKCPFSIWLNIFESDKLESIGPSVKISFKKIRQWHGKLEWDAVFWNGTTPLRSKWTVTPSRGNSCVSRDKDPLERGLWRRWWPPQRVRWGPSLPPGSLQAKGQKSGPYHFPEIPTALPFPFDGRNAGSDHVRMTGFSPCRNKTKTINSIRKSNPIIQSIKLVGWFLFCLKCEK